MRKKANQRSQSVALFFLMVISILSVLSCPGSSFAQAQKGDESNVHFFWALGALSGTGDAKKLESIRQDTALKNGDELKMLVALETKCFVYVIHSNGKDEVSMLFPYSLQQFATSYQVAEKYYIPQDAVWLKLDGQPGTDAIHLLASSTRLATIENLMAQYQAAADEHKPHIAQEVLTEIMNLKKQNRNLAIRAERPVAIGGAIRSLSPSQEPNPLDVATIAEEISATDFYARTFAIDHQ